MFEKERGTYARLVHLAQAMKSEDALAGSLGGNARPKRRCPGDFRHARRRVADLSRNRGTGAAVREKIWMRSIRASVNAIQIGNHPDWPATFHRVHCASDCAVLPLDKSVSAQERDRRVSRSVAKAPRRTGADGRRLFQTDLRNNRRAPRSIRFRSEQLLADCNQICETMGITDADLNFAVIPLSHSYGFSNLLTPLIARGVPMVLSSDRCRARSLHDLARTGATVFPGMPVFYQAFCEMEEIPALAIACDFAFLPARRCRRESHGDFSEKFRPTNPFLLRIVGMRRHLLRSRRTRVEDGFVGTAMKDVRS